MDDIIEDKAPEVPVIDYNDAEPAEKAEKKSTREHIKEAMAEVKERASQKEPVEKTEEKNAEKAPTVKTGRERDDAGKFQNKEAKITKEKPVVEKPAIIAAPDGLPAEIKAEWNKLPEVAQKALVKREADIHKGMTQMDEERSFAKEMQKTVMPYMPLINMSGSTPSKAVAELLNYAQILQTGTAQAKGQLLHQLAQRWNADMRITQGQPQPAQQLHSVQQQLQQTQAQLAKMPELIKQQQEQAQLQAVIDSFSADPKNSHYEKVKPVMAALLSSGQAKDMQDAYDQACYANPDIRSTLLAEKEKSNEAKRIADIKAKSATARSASVSIKGSSSINGAQPPKVKRSLREEIAHNLRAATH